MKLVFGKWSISHVQRNLLVGNFAVNVSKPSVQLCPGLRTIVGGNWDSRFGDLVFPLPEHETDSHRSSNAFAPRLVKPFDHRSMASRC